MVQDQFDAAVQENIDEFDMEVRSLNAPGHHLKCEDTSTDVACVCAA